MSDRQEKPKKWERAPKSKQAARDELHALDRKVWVAKYRREFLVSWLADQSDLIPQAGSLWVRTQNHAHFSEPRKKAEDSQGLYEFLHYAYGSPLGNFFVFRHLGPYGESKKRHEKAVREGRVSYPFGEPREQIVCYTSEVFHSQFDPAPKGTKVPGKGPRRRR